MRVFIPLDNNSMGLQTIVFLKVRKQRKNHPIMEDTSLPLEPPVPKEMNHDRRLRQRLCGLGEV